MGQILTARTDGLGHATRAAMATGRARFEQAPELPGDDEHDIDALTDDVIEVIGRACRAHTTNAKACADLLRNASEMLASLADEVAA